jgi:hypothetical protein
MELARSAGEVNAGGLLDMAKFYDGVNISKLVDDMQQHGYPALQGVLALEAYQAPRVLRKNSCWHPAVQVANSIVAGCTQATSLARLYLWNPIQETLQEREGTTIREFVDDLMTRRAGSAGAVVGQVVGDVSTLVRKLQAKACTISPKSIIISNSTKVASRIQEGLAALGHHFQVRATGRDLGVDTSFGKRRVVKTTRERRQAAYKRLGRVQQLGKGHWKARKRTFAPAIQTKAVWGTQVASLAPGQQKQLRSMAAQACHAGRVLPNDNNTGLPGGVCRSSPGPAVAATCLVGQADESVSRPSCPCRQGMGTVESQAHFSSFAMAGCHRASLCNLGLAAQHRMEAPYTDLPGGTRWGQMEAGRRRLAHVSHGVQAKGARQVLGRDWAQAQAWGRPGQGSRF